MFVASRVNTSLSKDFAYIVTREVARAHRCTILPSQIFPVSPLLSAQELLESEGHFPWLVTLAGFPFPELLQYSLGHTLKVWTPQYLLPGRF